ncbi:GMC oxidoreductase [Tilletiaria anomala UBC 951]|uniref:GMC oxidoreductase n=1 Tax=Tilletiaria anomala (strain ATCC 24038 / CBS 436.72 / UBC 951) TaxID=1037660 RepID=A0A066VP12_TILAU|nr:GMC oxidoreductase [Tilletiaria anomala UBC 951]KDN43206.1 GMC oxidoreductase [Tilletiaria anomala UBC 951]
MVHARRSCTKRYAFSSKAAAAAIALLFASAATHTVQAAFTHGRTFATGGKTHHFPRAHGSGITRNGNDLAGQTFDYVIAGGGLAGLVLASRLSEDADVTVAVIEAGVSGVGDDSLTIPIANLYDSSVGTSKDWQYPTTPQNNLDGKPKTWPRGKVLGGSSAINGLYMVRQSSLEQDLWASLAGNSTSTLGPNADVTGNAAAKWGWDNMLANMKRSETFTAPISSVKATLGSSVAWADSSHGMSGSIHHSWPGKEYASVGAFIQSVTRVTGIQMNADPYNGMNLGPFVATSAINPANWTRSFSRTGYLDPVLGRSNLYVLTGHLVTKVLFDNSSASAVRATGVQYAASPGAKVQTVKANREVILSAGAVGSPTILQLSGVADPALLSSLGIDQVVNLPGVGYHLQDHLSGGVTFGIRGSTDKPGTNISGNAVMDSYVNSAIAYVNLESLFGGSAGANAVRAQIANGVDDAVNSYNAPDAVKAGYRATYNAQAGHVFKEGSKTGPIELLFANTFGNIQVQTALQHPLSRGSVKITTTDPFTYPSIDAGYLTNSMDLQIIRQGFKLARQVGGQSPLSDLLSGEMSPGPGTTSDSDWETWLKANTQTEYHPTASCSMLPREMGGVVDENMLVYGTSNLRIIDASVPPLSMAMHLMTATYGLAEIGADMIKATRNNITYPGGHPLNSQSSSSKSGSGSGSALGAHGSSGGSSSGAARSGRHTSPASFAVACSVVPLLLASLYTLA